MIAQAGPGVLTFLVDGLFQGAVYGLLAVGLVLVYKGARVFNFAQGEFGTVAAFVTYMLVNEPFEGTQDVGFSLPYPVGLIGGLVAAVLVGLIMERLVIRPLFTAPRITVLVATVGSALFIIQMQLLIAKPEGRVLRPIVAGDGFNLFGATITPQELVIMGVLAVMAVTLALFFSRTNLGLAVLATSQDPLATRIVGISVTRMSRFIWAFAALLGGVAGVLQAGTNVFTPGFMTATTLVPAFTGAVLGGMTSLPGAFLGGLLVGAAQYVGGYFLDGVPGARELTVFALLLLVLMVRPQGILGTEA